MTPSAILWIILGYFGLLYLIGRLTSKKTQGNETFFRANGQAPWYLVAFGMIGASLSGVTFISVPGWVETAQFSYMQTVFGYLLGYWIIGQVLLPLYYKLGLTSIYAYLKDRFGVRAYQTGASFFLVSKLIGASFRLYLVVEVLYALIFSQLGIPYPVSILFLLLFIWLYTKKGGLKTIIFTDTLQTLFMLVALVCTIIVLYQRLNLESIGWLDYFNNHPKSTIFFWADWQSPYHFVKNFFSGVFIAIVMTGLDQDMMQKNLSCRNLVEAQRNMRWFSFILGIVNFCFLMLGLLLLDFATQETLFYEKGDQLFLTVATHESMPIMVVLLFVIGLIAAAYSSADSALTSMTTSFCIDILKIKEKTDAQQHQYRKISHLSFSILLAMVILTFRYTIEDSVIKELFILAGYTYGPILGLYAFGLLNRRGTNDRVIPYLAIVSPILCFILKTMAPIWWNYTFGFELLMLNGAFTFLGLYLFSKKNMAF